MSKGQFSLKHDFGVLQANSEISVRMNQNFNGWLPGRDHALERFDDGLASFIQLFLGPYAGRNLFGRECVFNNGFDPSRFVIYFVALVV